MPKDLFVTEDEREAIVDTMRHNFGACMCMQMGARTMRCPGHAFLAETDGPHDLPRIERMLYARRTSQQWWAAEWTGRCPNCKQDGKAFRPGEKMCVGCSDTLPITPFFEPSSLPW